MRAPADKASKETWSLALFIAGKDNVRSIAAYSNLKRICEEHLPGGYQLQVIDIIQHPERALEAQVVAIPMLERKSPEPSRRIIGDLADTNRVLVSLGLSSMDDPFSAAAP